MSRVEVERGSGRGLHPETLVQRPRAVMAGPHRNTPRVEQLADIVRMDRLPVPRGQRERNGAAAIYCFVRSEYLQAPQRPQPLQRVRRDLTFVGADLVHSDSTQVL